MRPSATTSSTDKRPLLALNSPKIYLIPRIMMMTKKMIINMSVISVELSQTMTMMMTMIMMKTKKT